MASLVTIVVATEESKEASGMQWEMLRTSLNKWQLVALLCYQIFFISAKAIVIDFQIISVRFCQLPVILPKIFCQIDNERIISWITISVPFVHFSLFWKCTRCYRLSQLWYSLFSVHHPWIGYGNSKTTMLVKHLGKTFFLRSWLTDCAIVLADSYEQSVSNKLEFRMTSLMIIGWEVAS